jgi:hypothetical protein
VPNPVRSYARACYDADRRRHQLARLPGRLADRLGTDHVYRIRCQHADRLRELLPPRLRDATKPLWEGNA